MFKAERLHISMIFLFVIQLACSSSLAATDAELKCEYLHCSIESLLSEFDDERMQYCSGLAKSTENTVFKGHFDQIMFWVNHNTPKEVIAACPSKKDIVEKLVNAETKYTREEVAQIEINHIRLRPRILEGLKEKQAEIERGVTPTPQSSNSQIVGPEGDQDLSTDLKPGEAGMKDYLNKAMNISHPMPLLPEHEKNLMCEMATCGYADSEGLIELGSENRNKCNGLATLLVVKSFKGELMLFSSWIQKAAKIDYLRKNCPTETQKIEPYEKQKSAAVEKSTI